MAKRRTPGCRKASDRRSQAIEDTFTSMRRVMGGMFARTRSLAVEHGISPPQMWVLRLLRDRDVSTPKELADAMCVTPANVTGLVGKLEASGFIARSADKKDRRVVRLELTPKALKGMDAMREAAIEGMGASFKDWSTADLLRLKALLDRLAAASPAPRGWRGPAGPHAHDGPKPPKARARGPPRKRR
jgi:DNA-binding MarR family transcriptional regulator